MKRHLAMTLGLTTLGVLIAASPAQANTDAWEDCSALYLAGSNLAVVGAVGGGDENMKSSTSLTNVNLYVKDTRADGYHVGIRLVTRRNNGSDHYWAWHTLYAGAGTHQSWYTDATDSGGIKLVWREVAVFKGSSEVTSCITKPQAN